MYLFERISAYIDCKSVRRAPCCRCWGTIYDNDFPLGISTSDLLRLRVTLYAHENQIEKKLNERNGAFISAFPVNFARYD